MSRDLKEVVDQKEDEVITSQPDTVACRKKTVNQIQGDEQGLGRRAHTQLRLSARPEDREKAVILSRRFQLFNSVWKTKSSRVLLAESIPLQETLQPLRGRQAVTAPIDKLVN